MAKQIRSDDSFYRIVIPSSKKEGKKSSLESRVVKVIKTDPYMPTERVQQALESLADDFAEGKIGKEITVSRGAAGDTLKIKFSDSTGQTQERILSSTTNASPPQASVKIQRLDTSFKPAKTFSIRFQKDMAVLDPSHNATYNLLLVVKLVFLPVTLLVYSALFVRAIGLAVARSIHEKEKQPLREKALSSVFGAPTFDTLLESMKVMSKVGKRLGSTSETFSQFESMILRGESIKKVMDGSLSEEDFWQNINLEIEGSSEQQPLVIPCGSYAKDAFIPSILIVYKGEEIDGTQQYVVKKISFDPSGESKVEKTQVIRNFTFESRGLKEFVIGMLKLQKAPPPLTSEESRRIERITAQRQPEMRPAPSTSIEPGLERLLQSLESKGTCREDPLSDEEKVFAFGSASSDPLSLLSLFARKPFLQAQSKLDGLQKQLAKLEEKPSENAEQITKIESEIQTQEAKLRVLAQENPEIADKAGFLHLFVSEMTRTLLKHASKLAPGDRDYYFKKLDDRIKKLERRLVKPYGPLVASEFIATLRNNIKKQVQDFTTNAGQKLGAMQKAALDERVAVSHPKVLVPTPHKTETSGAVQQAPELEARSTVGESIASPVNAAHCETIREAFSSPTPPSKEAIDRALTSLKALTTSANTLIEAKNYPDARLYLQTLLSLIPSVGDIHILDAFSKKQSQQLLNSITEIQKLFLETKIRLESPGCSTKELIGVFNAKTISLYFLRKESKEVVDRCKAALAKWAEDEEWEKIPKPIKDLILSYQSNKSKVLPKEKKVQLLNDFLERTSETLLRLVINPKKDEGTERTAKLEFFSLLCKEVHLTSEDIALFAYTGIRFDDPVAKDLLTEAENTLIELGRDPTSSSTQRGAAIVEALTKLNQSASALAWKKPFSFAFISETESYNSQPLQSLMKLFDHIRAQSGENDPQTDLNSIEKITAYLGELPSDPFEEATPGSAANIPRMPALLQQMRLSELLEGCILQPESSLYPALDKLSEESQSAEVSESKKKSGAVKAKRRLLQSQFREMKGRITFQAQEYPYGDGQTLLSLGCTDSSSESKLFFYPGTFAEPTHTTPKDREISSRLIGHRYAPLCRFICQPPPPGDLDKYHSSERHTTPQLIAWAKETPLTDLEPEVETSLASMNVGSHRSVMLALHFIQEHPLLLSHPMVRARLENILFQGDWLAKSFLDIPFMESWKMFLDSSLLSKIYKDSVEKEDLQAVSFLLTFFQHIQIQSEAVLKMPNRHGLIRFYEIISALAASLPTHQSTIETPSGTKTTLSWMLDLLKKDGTTIEDVRETTLHLIPLLGKEDIDQLSADDLAFFLFAWKQTKDNVSPLTGLEPYYIAEEKMETTLLPAIKRRLTSSTSDREQILSTLVTLEFGEVPSDTSKWKITSKEYAYEIRIGDSNAIKYSIDFKRGLIESSEQKGKPKLQEIPAGAIKDSQYRQVFGSEPLEGLMQSLGSSQLYEISYKGAAYKLELDTGTGKVRSIERKIGELWFRHLPASLAKDPSNFAGIIEEKGLWQNTSNKSEVWVFASKEHDADPRTYSYNIKLTVNLDGSLQEAKTTSGKIICLDTSRSLESTFPVCDPKNLLFLRSADSQQVDEVVFLREGFSLKRQGGKWVPSDKNEGWSVAQDSLKQVISRFGIGSLKVLLPLRRESADGSSQEWEYRIWARPILPSAERRPVTKLNLAQIENPPLLTLYKDAQDRLSGSHASFLYMAMICCAQGDMNQAALLLEQMSGPSAQTTLSQLSLLQELQKQLSTFPVTTDKTAAFLLKAELAIERIKEEQYHVRGSEDGGMQTSMQKIDRLLQLFSRYGSSVADPTKAASLQRAHLILSEEDKQEARGIHDHALGSIFHEYIEAPVKTKDPLKRPESVDPLFIIYLQSLCNPVKQIKLESLSLNKTLLTDFWSYVKLIQNSDPPLLEKDLSSLLEEIPLQGDKNLTYAIDMARRFLLTLAQLHRKDPDYKLTLPSDNNIKELRRYTDKKGPLSPSEERNADALLKTFTGSLQVLLKKAFEETRDPLLQASTELAKEPKAIPIGAFAKSLLESSELSKEEKALYREALETLGAVKDPSKAASLMSWISQLHQMQVMISTKREESKTLARIKQLEGLPQGSSLGSFDPVTLERQVTETSKTSTTTALREEFCSYSYDGPLLSDGKVLSETLEPSYDKEKAKEIDLVLDKLDRTLSSFPEPLEDEIAENPMKAREVLRLREGVTAAAQEQVSLIEGSKTNVLTLDSLNRFEKKLKAEVKDLQGKTLELRSSIIEKVRPLAAELGLYPLLSEPGKYSDEEVLGVLLDLYEDGKLNSLPKEIKTSIEQEITSFLVLSTKLHLIEKALDEPIGSVTQLRALEKEIRSLQGIGTLEADKKRIELSLEWKAASMELFKKLDRGYDLLFFSENKQSPRLDNQLLSRAALVFGYRQKIGVTKEQIDVIQRILDDPKALEELRMGLGKSFVISPLVARLMAKNGITPVVIFTEELIEQSRKDMDKRAYEFRFQRSPTLSSEELADEYKRMLEIKTSGRYLITTIGRLAALENKFHELKSVLALKKQSLTSAKLLLDKATPEETDALTAAKNKALAELTEVSNQLLWIQKIYLFFDPTLHGTRMFVDEVDAVLHISSEINYSEGTSENVDAATHTAGDSLFRKLFASTNPTVETLAKAFRENKVASFPIEDRQQGLYQLALELTDDQTFIEKSGLTGLSDTQKVELAKYLCGDEGITSTPDFITALSRYGAEAAAITSYKHWLTKTIPVLCTKSFGIDFGLADDGYTVVPMENGRAKPSTMFGEEGELIGHHLLAYYQQGCSSKEFFARMVNLIEAEAKAGSPWQAWLRDIGMPLEGKPDMESLFSTFHESTPEGGKLRAQFLEFMLLHTSSIQIYRSQIPLLVQDIIGVREFSGASGTMNKEALPASFTKSTAEGDPRMITGDLLMRFAMMDGGVGAEATVYSDPLTQMQKIAADSSCKAIINIGAPFVGQNTLDVITSLRNSDQGAGRQYIFIHPTQKTAYFWDIGESAPKPFDKVRDAGKVDAEKCLYYFSPADTRGTDFKIPSGYGAIITGPTTTLPKLEQATWRLRKLGMGHSAKFFVEESLARRISGSSQKQSITVAKVFTDILEQTVTEDGLSNFKLQALAPACIVKTHVKDTLMRMVEEAPASSYLLSQDAADESAYLSALEPHITLYDAIKTYFRREQRIDYSADFDAARPEDTLRFLSNIYSQEIQRVEGLIARLQKEPSPPCQRIVDALQLAKADLEKRKVSIEEKHSADRLRSVLPKTVESNTSLDAGAIAEVQQQQQQQTLTSVKRFVSSSSSSEVVDPEREATDLDYTSYANIMWLSAPEQLLGPDQSDFRVSSSISIPEDTVYKDLSLPENFFFSSSISRVLSISKASGKIDAYLLYTDSGNSIILSSLDIEHALSRASQCSFNCKIYALSLHSESSLPLRDYLTESSTEEPFLLRLALSKALLGSSVFSEGEKKALHNWYRAQAPKEREKIFTRLRSLGGVTIADELEKWHREPNSRVKSPAGITGAVISGEVQIKETLRLPEDLIPTRDRRGLSDASITSTEKLPEREGSLGRAISETVMPKPTNTAPPNLAPSQKGAPKDPSEEPIDLTEIKQAITKMDSIPIIGSYLKGIIEPLLGSPLSTLIPALEEAKFTYKELDDIIDFAMSKGKIFSLLKTITPYIKNKTLRTYYEQEVKPKIATSEQKAEASYKDPIQRKIDDEDLDRIKDSIPWIAKQLINGFLGFSISTLIDKLKTGKFTYEEIHRVMEFANTQKGKKIITGKQYIPYITENTKTLRAYYNENIKPAPSMAVKPAAKASKPAPSAEEVAALLARPKAKAAGDVLRLEPFSGFIVDQGGAGNCGALSLLDQVRRRGILKSGGGEYTNQQELRALVKSYLSESQIQKLARANITEDTPEAPLMATIVDSMIEARRDGIIFPLAIVNILDAIAPGTPLSQAQKTALLTAYATEINKNGFWLDKGYFALAAAALGKQIVILRPGDTRTNLIIEERFPANAIDQDKALFIYYNGSKSGGGYHFQSIELLHTKRLSFLLNKDRELRISNFTHAISDRKAPRKKPTPEATIRDENLSTVTKNLDDLRKFYPEAHQAVLSLLSERLGRPLERGAPLSDEDKLVFMEGDFNLSEDAIKEKIRSIQEAESRGPRASGAAGTSPAEPAPAITEAPSSLPPPTSEQPNPNEEPGFLKKLWNFFGGK